ncbi:hypothetical protein [Aestuariivita boseongensis]|uniref:hypothetical protein n=1 Tax=Aestuariivita boseongensis TaxID=1470562 RepID=UPI001FE02C6A|nr:hypothetical protein [Aestuariivita boseongensis]
MRHRFTLVITTALGLSTGVAWADTPTGIGIELNAADTIGDACRLTFVATNGSANAVDQAVFETVLFSEEGRVTLMTLFDFGALPAGVPRVRQFQIPDISCNRLGLVLVNGADTCRVQGVEAEICGTGLSTTSRTDIEMKG